MARTLTVAAVVLMFAIAMVAQSPEPIPAGTLIPVILKSNLNAKKVKVGDEVKLEVTDDVLGADKVKLIPRKAKVTGHVTRVQPREKDSESILSIVAEKAEWKNGSASFHAIIAGKVRPPEVNPELSGSANPRGMGAGQQDSPRAAIAEGMSAHSGVAQAAVADDFKTYQGATTSGVQATMIEGIGLRRSSDPAVISELVAPKKNLELESGSTMVLRNMPPPAAAKP